MTAELIGWTAAAFCSRQSAAKFTHNGAAALRKRIEMAFRRTNDGLRWLRHLQLATEKLGIRSYKCADAKALHVWANGFISATSGAADFPFHLWRTLSRGYPDPTGIG